ncbi:apolipoprotein N-acyltransferase [Kushneria indalinina]|uniref:Apolipoprotein N-acyltransferase n=1 Tax=Kushneria indalinina DSM 14324 TaxID=1122140 RepID=A0A3D9E2A3_9GAMM|nr:apolipoprotein N-acyltransferase [Kushneria indalinina]REC96639.1 apolipoprotein N-acyltransferase [Kushneria indalinina DSM 14324]
MASLLQRRGAGSILALLAGALTTLTFAPFNLWGLGPMALAVFYVVLQKVSLRQALWRGWLFGVGMFGSGASWVYVSIHDYGNTGGPLAIVLTVLFIIATALFVVLPALLYRLCAASRLNIVAFAGAWALSEAFRSWAFTGFPWLFLGSAHVSSPLASLAPLGGVYLVSLVVALSGALLAGLVLSRTWWLIAPLAALWLVPLALPTQWAEPAGDDVTVSLVQGDLAQLSKWTPDGQRDAVNTYFSLTRQHGLDSDIVIWPETALPMLEQQAMPFLQRVQSTLPADSTLMTGIMQRDQNGMFYNSMISLGEQPGQYRKAHLVPFGEYLPLEPLLGGLLRIFNIPMGNIGAGSDDQPPLQAHGLRLGVAICYEIVYPDLVRARAENANALVTISNDTWFGHSIGPLQHMQMAQLRALENNRYLIRATNNGMTAIVAPDGHIVGQAPRFEPAVLYGAVRPMEGLTPFTRTGSWPALLLALLMLFCGGILRSHRRNQNAH